MAPEIRLTAQWVAAAMAGTLVDGERAAGVCGRVD